MQTFVYWDTCAYREIIKQKYKRPEHAQSIEAFAAYISNLERERGYKTPPYAIVLWELVSHLPAYSALHTPDTIEKDWEMNFKSCFFACRFAKHQSFRVNGSFYTPFPQSLLARGIDTVHPRASFRENCRMYDRLAHILCSYIANFDEATADRESWRHAPELTEVASGLFCKKRQWNDLIIEELRKFRVQEPPISQNSFVLAMKNAFAEILYDCVRPEYRLDSESFKWMHAVSDAFVEKWAQNIYTNVRDAQCISDWVYENKLSNTFVDALLLAIFSDKEEETRYMFVTLDGSILYQNSILSSSNHKIIDLHEYLRDIGAEVVLPD